jgi:hypothetical protein
LAKWVKSLLALTAQLHTINQHSQELHEELRKVEYASRRAVEEMGDRIFAEQMTLYQPHKESVERAKQAVVDAQVEQHHFLASACELLAPWPHLQKQVRQELPYDDSMTRILDSAIAFMEILLVDGGNVPRRINLPTANGYVSWLALIEVPGNELYGSQVLGGGDVTIKKRLHLARQFRNEYLVTRR